MFRRIKKSFQLFRDTYREWSNDNTSQMGAALAYYGVFALAPLVLIAVAIAGAIYGEQAAQGEVRHRLHYAVGTTVAGAIEDSLKYSQTTGSGITATVISIVVLIVAALSLFEQLQVSLNTIWGVQVRADRTWWDSIRGRLTSFGLMLGIALLLLASLITTSVLETFNHYLHLSDSGRITLWRVVNWAVSFVLLTVLFAMIYKLLPDVKIGWRDVWVGAAITAILFTAGNYLIGLYLGRTSTTSAYGAAGSIVILLLWVYYSSQILLFGAEFTQVYANCYGAPLVAEEVAELRDDQNRPRKKLAERCGYGRQRPGATRSPSQGAG